MQPAPINTEDNVRDYPRAPRMPPDPGISFPSGRYLAQLLRGGARRLAGAYRRRRRLLLTPIVVMVPLSVALAFLLPRTFETSSLLLLQETARNNPLTDPVAAETLQQKVPGLEALLKSDQVLTRVVREMQQNGSHLVSSDLPNSTRSLRKALSVELIGTDFLAVRLRGPFAQGLDRDLSTVVGAFLEALLSEPATSASQVVLSKQQQYLAGLEQRRREIQDKIAAAPPTASDGASPPPADLQQQLVLLEQQIANARGFAEALSRRYPASNTGTGSGILSAPGRIKIVDPPKDPLPTTSRITIILAGSVTGVLLGFMLAWATEVFDPIIYDTDDLVAAAGVPLLTTLSRHGAIRPAALPFAAKKAPHRWIPVVIFAIAVVLGLIYLGSSDAIQRQWRSWFVTTTSQSMLNANVIASS